MHCRYPKINITARNEMDWVFYGERDIALSKVHGCIYMNAQPSWEGREGILLGRRNFSSPWSGRRPYSPVIEGVCGCMCGRHGEQTKRVDDS
jgi:hypothetical protein